MKRYFILCLFSFLCLSAMADEQSAALNQGEKGQIVPDATQVIKDTEVQNALTAPAPKEKKRFAIFKNRTLKGDTKPDVLNTPAPEQKGKIVPARTFPSKKETELNPAEPLPIHSSAALHAKKGGVQEPALNNPIPSEKGRIVPAQTLQGKKETELNSTEPLPIHESVVQRAKKDEAENTPAPEQKGKIIPARTMEGKRDLEQNSSEPIPIHQATVRPAKKDEVETPILYTPAPEEKREIVPNQTEKLKDIDKPDSVLNTPAPEGKGIIVPLHSIKGKTDN